MNTIVDDVKGIIRNANGAMDFVMKAKMFGFRPSKEDFFGEYRLTKDDCTLIVALSPSGGPDRIWSLSLALKGSDMVNLIRDGRNAF
jgi:hypothetical protein